MKTHGLHGSPTYRSWVGMVSRCTNAKAINYHNYGGRGITVCERWLKFEHFLADMGIRPEGTTLDRKDNDGNYEPSNCKWSSQKEQDRNKRSNRLCTFNGRTQSIQEWAEEIGIKHGTLWSRLYIYGWPIERALTAKTLSLSEAGRLGGEALKNKLAAESIEVERGQI